MKDAIDFSAQFGIDLGSFLATCAGLLVFSWLFNRFVDYLHHEGLNDGYTWLEVVIGTAVTLIVAGATIGWTAVVVLFAYFACSGFFMAGGDIWRHVQARKREAEQYLGSSHLEDIVNGIDLDD